MTAIATDLSQLADTLDSLLAYVNDRCSIVRPTGAGDSLEDHRMKCQLIQRFVWEHTSLIDDYVRDNPDHLGAAQLAVASDLAGTLYGTFHLLSLCDHMATLLHHTGIYTVMLPDGLLPHLSLAHAELRGALAPFHDTIVPIPPFAILGDSDPQRMALLRAQLAGSDAGEPTADPHVLSARARAWGMRVQSDRKKEAPCGEPLPAGPGYHRGALAGLDGDARKKAIDAHLDEVLCASGWHQHITEVRCLDVETLPVTLEEALCLLDDDWLDDITFELDAAPDEDEPPREQLIGSVCQRLASDRDAACMALMWCPDEQFRLIDLLMDTNPLPLDNLRPSEAQQLHSLVPYVFMLSEHGRCLAWMAPEVRALLSKIDLKRMRKARRRLSEARNAARGLATMCGVIRIGQVYDRYRRVASNPLERHQFETALEELQAFDQRDDYMLWKHAGRTYAVATEVSDASAPMRVARESFSQSIVDRDAPGSQESPLIVGLSEDEESSFAEAIAQKEAELEHIRKSLVAHNRHSNPPELPARMLEVTPFQALVELDALRALRSFVDAHVPDNEDDYEFADTFVRSVAVSATLMSEPYNETMDLIRLYRMEHCEGTEFSDTLGRLVTNAYNALPRWDLNGWSLEQNTERLTGRRRFFAADGTVRHIADDDPCPCGSGKAYGRCCGHLE